MTRATANTSKPELVIYLAGADPYGDDRLGRLSLSYSLDIHFSTVEPAANWQRALQPSICAATRR